GTADHLLKYTADATGCGHTFYPTRVGILQAPNGEAVNHPIADPFFGGEGPARGTCSGCGGCMMGCRYGAKNTLDLNYLYLAEKHGAKIFCETKVVDVRPLTSAGAGEGGYEVRTVNSTRLIHRKRQHYTCRGII